MNVTEALERIKTANINPEIIATLERVIEHESNNALIAQAISSVAACCFA